ncbi:hypothetical protein B0H11DRAFT_2219827 [Mycena galericulata]|nr:hypothetical protein B0H11DRAFT_2219827 [Mycena galericulata]
MKAWTDPSADEVVKIWNKAFTDYKVTVGKDDDLVLVIAIDRDRHRTVYGYGPYTLRRFTVDDEEMDIDEDSPSLSSMLTAETKDVHAGWDVILEFATTKMSLPQAEKCLKQIFGTGYVASDGKAALDAVMDSEENSAIAEPAARALMPNFTKDLTAASSLPAPIANDRRLKAAEGASSSAGFGPGSATCWSSQQISLCTHAGSGGIEGSDKYHILLQVDTEYFP